MSVGIQFFHVNNMLQDVNSRKNPLSLVKIEQASFT